MVYEPFDYPVGALNGANGGIGFDGPWTAATETRIAGGTRHYGSLPSTGNAIGDLSVNANRFGGTRKISPSALAAQGLLADGASLWLGAIVGYEEDASLANSYLLLALANNGFNNGRGHLYIDDETSQRGSGVGVWLGKSGNYQGKIIPAEFRDVSQGTDRKSWIAIPNQPPTGIFKMDTYFRLIAVKFTWGAKSDTIELYSPKEDLILPQAPYSSFSANVDQTAFDTLTWTRADKIILDEIRLGPTYESVGGLSPK